MCVRVRHREKAEHERCCCGKTWRPVLCPLQRRGKGWIGEGGEVVEDLETKRKRQQMLWKFLDKATHVLLLEGIAEMTVKPQRRPALCHSLAQRKYCTYPDPHSGKTIPLCVHTD